MKKTALLMALILAFGLFGCAKPAETDAPKEARNELERLVLSGYGIYDTTMSRMDDVAEFRCIVRKEESLEHVYLVKMPLTSEQYDALDALWLEDDAETKRNEIIFEIHDVTVQDLADKMPSEGDLKSWEGKTMGDLEEAGFYMTGCIIFDDETFFFYEGPFWGCRAFFDKPADFTDSDTYPDEKRQALVITKMEFEGVASGLVDYEE